MTRRADLLRRGTTLSAMVELVEPIPATPASAFRDEDLVGPVYGGRARVWRTLRRSRSFWVGATLSGLIVFIAAMAPVLAPHDPLEQFRDAIPASGDPAGPSARFPLGTDPAGRDYLSRLMYGARTSLVIGIGANFMAVILGVAVGATAALAASPSVHVGRGRRIRIPVEGGLMRLTDLWISFPILLLTITIAFVLGPSVGLVVVIIGLTLWTATARIVYGRMLVLRESAFFEASRAVGATMWHIFGRSLLPHLLPLIVVYASLGIAAAVLFEATLSYLGAGVPPPTPTWGTMLADHVSWFATQPRLVALPGLCITLTVLGFNLLADALRDALDPRA